MIGTGSLLPSLFHFPPGAPWGEAEQATLLPAWLFWLLSHGEVAGSGNSVAHYILDIYKLSVAAAAKRKQKWSLPSGRQTEQREEKSKHLGYPANPGAVGDNSSTVLGWGCP